MENLWNNTIFEPSRYPKGTIMELLTGGNQQLSNWMQGLINRRQFILGTVSLELLFEKQWFLLSPVWIFNSQFVNLWDGWGCKTLWRKVVTKDRLTVFRNLLPSPVHFLPIAYSLRCELAPVFPRKSLFCHYGC